MILSNENICFELSGATFPASVHTASFMSKANISVWGGVLVYAFTKSLIGYKDVF